jgi:hypothetical protein
MVSLVPAASHTDADSRRELRQKQIAAVQENLAVASSSCLGSSSRAFPGAGRMMQRYSSQKLQLTTDFVQDSGWAPALRRRRFVDEELTRFS